MTIEKKYKPEVFVFIDASNIRSACLKSCNFNIDFLKLYEYLNKKYKKLKEVRYYEGISRDDKEKKQFFDELAQSGYVICSLQRRTYIEPAISKTFECRECGHKNRVQVLPKIVKMKSNVDVYLAAEMLEIAYEAKKPTHIVLFTCDGDYAEAIKIAVKNKDVKITVVATPPIRDKMKNTLSIRLKELRGELAGQYHLNNIEDIKDSIKL